MNIDYGMNGSVGVGPSACVPADQLGPCKDLYENSHTKALSDRIC